MGIKFNEETGEFEEVAEDNSIKNASSNKSEDIEIRFTEESPIRRYDESTGCYEYKDPELKKIANERKNNHDIKDELQYRLTGIRKHLKRADLEDNIGKTGNSSTGKVSEQDKRVAKIQTKHAKEYILRNRLQRQ